ncbi:MAG: hypothetical protein WC858_02215 [Parcubacteria group bacterium]|jgi:hypothetical protein
MEKLKKHTGKFLFFVVNFLVMTVAVLIIKDKDQEGKLLKSQNNLLSEEGFLSEENNGLKIEPDRRRGTVEEIDAQDSETVETDPTAQPDAGANINAATPEPNAQNLLGNSTQTQTGTNSKSKKAKASNSSSKNNSSSASSNSKTKTS